jgi:hypothetical protein
MGMKAKAREQRKRKFCALMKYNKKLDLKKGQGIKPKVTFGAFGSC